MNTIARRSLLSHTAQLFAAQARVYCLSALVAGVLGITALTIVSTLVAYNAGSGSFDAVAVWKSMSFSRQMMFVFGLLFALWSPILLAARGVCRITADHLAGQPVSLGNVLGDMARFIPAAIIYALVIGFPMMIGISILIVPGIVVTAFFALVIPAGVNESLGIFGALRRGVSLGMRVLGKELSLTFASAALIVVLIVLRITLLDRFLPSAYRALYAVRFALTYIPALLVLILANISFTLLYHEARGLEAKATPGTPSAPPS
jgi:hypothetical protein